MLKELNSKIIIKINGDPDPGRKAVVVDTHGQGTSLSPKGVGLTVGKTVDEAIPVENNDQVGTSKVSSLFTVHSNARQSSDMLL